MKLLREHIRAVPALQRLREAAGPLAAGSAVRMTGVAGSLLAVLVAELRETLGHQLLVVARDNEAAERMRDDLTMLAGADALRWFSGRDRHSADGDINDVQTLRSLLGDSISVIVTSPRGLVSTLPLPASIEKKAFTLEAGSPQVLHQLISRLSDFGFIQKDFVEAYGDYAVRGGIVDVFPFVGDHPVRLEFFGDTIESIREFDPISQRSIKPLSVALIVPDLLARDSEMQPSEPDTTTLLSYLRPDAYVLLDEPDLISAAVAEAKTSEVSMSPPLEERLGRFPQIHRLLLRGGADDTIDFGSLAQPSFNGSIKVLARNLAELHQQGLRVVVTCDSQSELVRLKDLLASNATQEGPQGEVDRERSGLDFGSVEFSLDSLHEGFILPSGGVALYTEHQVFNRLKRRGKKRLPRFKGFSEKEFQQLRKGDYVVHQDYGIGRFDGLKRIRVRSVEQEVVTLLYEEKDRLYVNLNYVTKLQKYSSKEGHIPKLSRLGSADWDRLKARAKKRVKDIARDLIRLYAKRKHMTGFAFQPDMPWQKELEASFIYEDTFDQAKATLEVKQDMETPSPMDRLICGDVGFGKTEVAVRAAFKAVLNGKQVAILVPTTILAVQHFNTFVDRTGRYGTVVQTLSRFKLKKEQAAIIEQLKAGTIDIVIGTHRLLSKDVGFKDLGLLIIDEEHRFGVAAKEKLRQLRAGIDTLSLTATPIPRTLHFSLMGARDLSLIATPPRNRMPVITEITQWNDDMIREAVMREKQRGGQTYFVHDRVQNIEEVVGRLQEILPGVRLRFAHGQMHAHRLEEVMLGFLEKRFDVLVSTKIIESGLDIPNVNTIIINRADRFGMAELYQLRGRVGRSNTQAFAYLLTPPVAVVPRTTLQRLQAIEEFTELGSGFNLAMRDLEIRGAGNLLGSEQSGFIETMGFETYTRILEEAVQELKEEEFQDIFPKSDHTEKRSAETIVEADFDLFIPEQYVYGDQERLAIYRRLYGLSTDVQLQEVAEEMRDRFGKFPSEVENLFGAVRLRLAAAAIGFKKAKISSEAMEVDFPPDSETRFYESESFQQIMQRISELRDHGAVLKQMGNTLTLVVKFTHPEQPPHPLQRGTEFLIALQSGESA